MAMPSKTASTTGVTDAGGAWSFTGVAGSAGHVVIVQIVQDGATSNAVAVTGATNIADLAGVSNQWTSIGKFPMGASAAFQHLFIGRLVNTSAPTISGTNSTSEDLYCLFVNFQDVSTGTTLATVIENGTPGQTSNGTGNTSPIGDTAVTTLGRDRLALNFVGIDDDQTSATTFTGATGGTWSTTTTYWIYSETSGTDAYLYWVGADMPLAGTINGGTMTYDGTDNWGCVGFALIGTTPPSLPFKPSPHHLIRR